MQTTPTKHILSRDQHRISRKLISSNALRVLYRLREAGFASFLVGGAVRDLLLGGAPKDFDVATDATPEQVRQLFRNCRLIGRRFRLAHVLYGRETIEVATFRANSDDGSGAREVEEGRLVRDNVYGSIEDDAMRRDFTANALYYSIADFSVHDFVGGVADVEARRLRLIGDPVERCREDPVRMLRAARLAAKLGFSIEAATESVIPLMAELLVQSSSARLYDECVKLFLSGHGVASFQQLRRLALLPVLFPDAAAALAADLSGRCLELIERALADTDRRGVEARPVSPVFVFAVLLWPAYAVEVTRLLGEGHSMAVSEQRAADRVLVRQCARIAIPRRIGQPIETLWLTQSRFTTRQNKRVQRLLAQPHFRAAFDLLAVRSAVVPELGSELAFWTEAQGVSTDHSSDHPAPAQPDTTTDAADGSPTVSAHRPRRRRRSTKPVG